MQHAKLMREIVGNSSICAKRQHDVAVAASSTAHMLHITIVTVL